MNWQRRLRFPRNSTSPLRSKPLTAFSVSSSRHSPRVSLFIIRGFGTFQPTECKERPARDFKTGKPVVIPAHKSAKFRVSKDFIKFLNAEAGKEATV